MTDDRALLEAAARAAGIVVERSRLDDPACRDILVKDSARNPHQKYGPWNPLTDDGDALRLAVRRRFHINIFSACESEGIKSPGFVEVWDDGDLLRVEYVEAGDYEAATRRAIVRAAAAQVQWVGAT